MKWRSLQESEPFGDIRPLKQIFAERRETIARYASTEARDIHERTVAQLASAGLAAKALGAGARAPSFELKDHNGEPASSAVLLGKGALVLVFIRDRWCPFCVGQLEAMNYVAAQIEAAGASLVAVSPQTKKQAYFMHNQHKLRFPLLVDEHNARARQLGLVYRVPEEQQQLYLRTFVNLPMANGDDSWELPIPATYVLDRKGRILLASACEDYSDRPEPLDILATVETLRRARGGH